MHFGVLGAGVVGLTTALELQREFPNAQVTILAEKFLRDTTSDVAAGIFRPSTSFSGPNEEITRKWISDAFNYWDDIRRSSEASQAGVAKLSGYIFSSKSPEIVRNHFLEPILPIYRAATEAELKLCPGDWKYGSFFSTVVTECRIFQPWATQKFLSNGGAILQQKVENITDLHNQFDVLANCSGLNAKYLCNDRKVVPIRGQVVKVHAPFLKTAFYADYDTYIIPGFEAVTLGGCRNFESYDTSISKYDSAAIRERCEALVPSLKGAAVVREAVGLRPYRDTVRVEAELKETPQGVMKIVHNYGHGGYGVTTAPGTAKYCVKLVKVVMATRPRL